MPAPFGSSRYPTIATLLSVLWPHPTNQTKHKWTHNITTRNIHKGHLFAVFILISGSLLYASFCFLQIKPEITGGVVIEVGSQFKADFALSDEFNMMRERLRQIEDKWERSRDKDVSVQSFDRTNLFKPENVATKVEETELAEEAKKFDLEMFKAVKSLDLAKHEQELIKRHNVSPSDEAGVARVKAKIAQLKAAQETDPNSLRAALKKYNPAVYKQFEQAFPQ